MAEKTYRVNVTRFGNVLNRAAVDKAAMEGRVITPMVEYVEQGKEVKLDPDANATKRALASGAIEEPGASADRERERLQAELDRITAQQDALEAQRNALAGDTSDEGPTLAELQAEAERVGVAKSGTKAEIQARLDAAKSGAAS